MDAAFRTSPLGQLDFLAGIPEYKVALPGGDTASQTDLFVLARTRSQETVAIAVEGKAREAFGDKTVADWRLGASSGRVERLRFLLKVLGLPDDAALGEARYQLLHRTATPLIEAERLHADHAVMLVHSFHEPDAERKWFDEFEKFAKLLDADVSPETVARARRSPRSLFLGWVSDLHPEVER